MRLKLPEDDYIAVRHPSACTAGGSIGTSAAIRRAPSPSATEKRLDAEGPGAETMLPRHDGTQSTRGAAVRIILHAADSPNLHLIVYPVPMQGEDLAVEIYFNRKRSSAM